MNSISICYHADCTDGWTSAWVALQYFNACGTHFADIELVPVQHGKSHPTIKPGTIVYYLDFFPGCMKLLEVAKTAKSVVVLDHHATAKKELDDYNQFGRQLPSDISVVFSDKMSGALLTWTYLRPYDKPPALVRYVSDNDIWAHKLPNSREVAAYVQSHNHTVADWDYLSQLSDQELILRSSEVWRVKQNNATLSAKNAYEKTIHCNGKDQLAAVVNVSFPLTQDTLAKLLETYVFAIGYSRTSDGKWKISARSKDQSKITAQEFCESMQGGGHRNAAGATVASTPLHLM